MDRAPNRTPAGIQFARSGKPGNRVRGGVSSMSVKAGPFPGRRGGRRVGRVSRDLLIAGVTGLSGPWVLACVRMLRAQGRALGGESRRLCFSSR